MDEPLVPDALPPTMTEAARVARTLPVYDVAADLLDAVRRHQVVVLEGPTGSGKTTQLPRILWHGGITDKVIGVTQPRRIAATSVAARIADEEGVAVGALVGHCIRFDDQTSAATRIKIMTDGILLEEARSHGDFDEYGVIMVDEAHERTLNVDVTLGLLARALRRRADLRVVVSSATLDPETFVRFFESLHLSVATVAIASRPYPVRILYRPVTESGRDAVPWAVCNEVERIVRGGEPGHVLCFLSGEGPIQQAVAELTRRRIDRQAEILPLYGAMEQGDQERVFHDFRRRKIVLATNIAETSITVPDVRFVIDGGIAKVPRFDPRLGIRTLTEEKVAQANCDQRSGRAGRTAPGVAIRLYSPKDYADRPAYADEEIRRLDLREVVLRLLDLGIRDLEAFDLPTPPSRHRLREALAWLGRMEIIGEDRHLTAIGRRLTPFPLGPVLGLMVVHCADEEPQALREVLVLAAFLSSRRPWLFPIGEEGEAQTAHQRYFDPRGDVAALLQLWRGWQDARDKDAYCKQAYVDRNVLAFVDRAARQLADIAERLGMKAATGGDVDEGALASFCAGHRDQILYAQGRLYVGPGGVRAVVHPGSACAGTRARFLVAGEIIVLARTYASMVAEIQPRHVQRFAPELAAQLRLKRPSGGETKRAAAAAPPPPSEIVIDGVRLPVVDRRGRRQVEVPYDAIAPLRMLKPAAIAALAPAWADIKARVLIGDDAWAAGTPLRTLLRLLRTLPLPAPGVELPRAVHEGVLFESDRNLHGLMRHLDAVLAPTRPGAHGKPGWLTLIGNGAGGFWFEVLRDYAEAVASSADGLDQLLGQIHDADPDLLQVEACQRRVAQAAEALEQALERGGRGRRGR